MDELTVKQRDFQAICEGKFAIRAIKGFSVQKRQDKTVQVFRPAAANVAGARVSSIFLCGLRPSGQKAIWPRPAPFSRDIRWALASWAGMRALPRRKRKVLKGFAALLLFLT